MVFILCFEANAPNDATYTSGVARSWKWEENYALQYLGGVLQQRLNISLYLVNNVSIFIL